MIRRAFVRRMMGAALASGLLGSELLTRRPASPTRVEFSVAYRLGEDGLPVPDSISAIGQLPPGMGIDEARAVFHEAMERRPGRAMERMVRRWGEDLVEGSGGTPGGLLP